MFPNVNSDNATDIRLPFSFIFFGLFSLNVAQWLILFNGDLLLDGAFRSPSVWMAAHFLLLGWGVLTAMGAMYQLVPVAFITEIWNERLGFVQMGVTIIGVLGLAAALGLNLKIAYIFGIIVVLGILLFLFQMYKSLQKPKNKSIITLFVGTALGFLLITVLLGLTLALSLAGVIHGVNQTALLKSHILFGVAGWFTFLIFGFSYKLLPMFALSHGFSMKLSNWTYGVYVSGMLLALISFYISKPAQSILFALGMALLAVGFTLFLKHMKHILSKKLKKQLDKGFLFAIYAITSGSVIYYAGVLASLWPGAGFMTFAIIIYVFVMGWVTFSIMGYLFKIVPFLWWTHRYGDDIGKTNVPTMQEMTDEKAGAIVYKSVFVSLIVIILSLVLRSELLFYIGQGAMSVLIVWYTKLIVDIIRK